MIDVINDVIIITIIASLICFRIILRLNNDVDVTENYEMKEFSRSPVRF